MRVMAATALSVLVSMVPLLARAAEKVAVSEEEMLRGFLAIPPSADIRAALPPAAAAHDGRVILRCRVAAGGAVSDCRSIQETPAGLGAGRALARLAPQFRLDPGQVANRAPEGEVTIPIGWSAGSPAPATPPDWLRRPTPQELRAAWPAQAWAKGLEGRAEINCLVATTGRLFDCVTLAETPHGESFGAAAIALTPQLLMRPATRQGKPFVSTVTIPVNFVIPGGWNGGHGVFSRRLIPPAITWTEAPALSDVLAAYPAKARAARVSGAATVQCGFNRQGGLTNCHLVRQDPETSGFGAAALALARKFRLAPEEMKTIDLRQATVALPFAFDLPTLERGVAGKPAVTRSPDRDGALAALQQTKPAHRSGRVMLRCRVRSGGGLGDCTVGEEPAGSGLGATALALKDAYRMATWSDEGLPVVGGSIQVPVRFMFEEEPAPTQAAAKP